jgi:protein-disulfide isomerase
MSKKTQLGALAGIVGVVLAVGAGVIFTTNQQASVQGAAFDYSAIPQSRTEDGAHVLGDPNAPITIVEFADFQCGHCQNYKAVMNQVIEELVITGKAKFEYRHFPTVDRSAFTMRLNECAAEQDDTLYWVAHDTLYDLTQRGWTQTSSQEFSDRLGLNYGTLLNCVQGANQWETDARLGDSAGVTGTPAIRIRVGDSGLQPLSPQFERGGPPFSAIEAVVNQYQ